MKKDKIINTRKELRSLLQKTKFFTFSQAANCHTYRYNEKLCKIITLSDKLRERVHDKLGPWFDGPKFLLVFENTDKVRKFIEVNMPLYESRLYVSDPDTAYTLLMAIANADLRIHYDFHLNRIYQRHKHEDTVVPEFKDFKLMKACLNDMLLVINKFKNKE